MAAPGEVFPETVSGDCDRIASVAKCDKVVARELLSAYTAKKRF